MSRCTMRMLGSLPWTLLLLAAAPRAETPAERCGTCHGEQAQQLLHSVHGTVDLSCTGCHGGGNAAAVNKEEAHGAELRALREPRQAVELCGGCHSDLDKMRRYGLRTDQLVLYKTSPHGQKLFENADPDVATCVSCHGSHAVLQVRDPLSAAHKLNELVTCGGCHGDAKNMGRHSLASDIPALYRKSVHGVGLLEQRRLASPGCTDCHGSHGATPPRVEEAGAICGQCHATIREEFKAGPHFQASKEGRMQECVSCHGDHQVEPPSTEMFVGDEARHCGSCHAGAQDRGAAVARALHDGLGGLGADIGGLEAELRQAAALGIFIEAEQGYLEEARALFVRARTKIHSVSPDALKDLLNRGKAMNQETRERLGIKTRWLRDRRIYAGAFFLGILVFVSLLLILRREVKS